MTTQYSHTNIVARDPETLAQFYTDVFDCTRSVQRSLREEWLGRGMGMPGISLEVIHLRLPGTGAGASGPTLEIFRMPELRDGERSVQDRPGIMHTAFVVDDIEARLELLIDRGGETLGEIVDADVEDLGHVRFVYARDPEGNIVELQELS